MKGSKIGRAFTNGKGATVNTATPYLPTTKKLRHAIVAASLVVTLSDV
jgi:hypothetical protein